MLDRWQHQLNSSTNRNQSAGDGTNHQHHLHDGPSAEDEPPTVGSCTATMVTEDDSNSTTEAEQERAAATGPTTITSDPQQQEPAVVPAEESSRISFPPIDRDDDDDDRDNNNTNEEEDSDSNSSDDDSDGDSVDYGGAETSVWQGVGQSFLSAGSVIGSTSNSSSNRADAVVGATGGRGTTTNAAIAATTTTTTTNPPPMTASAKSLVTTSTDRLVMDNYDHYDDDDDDDDDMAHQGAEVFLYTESKNKYNNHYTTDATNSTAAIGGVVSTITTTNKLFDITEAKQHQRENVMTETARIIQETTAATADNYEDLEFTPRLEDDDDADEYEDLTFTYKSPSAHNKHNNLKLAEILLSPDNDNNSNSKPQSQQRDNLMSPLSAMVHPINLDLFQNDDLGRDDNDDNVRLDQSFASSSIATTDNCDNWSVSSCPVSRRLSDMIPSSSDRSVGSSRTSSSFRSSSMAGGRVRYSLSTGKRSMSKAQRQYSKDFLPKSLLILPPPAPLLEKEMLPHRTAAPTARSSNSSKNNSNKHNSNNSTLSVLLVDVQQHIFEVIAVDCYYKDDCTVGDVLSKARASATDPALSEQKYISLVYGQQEFAAPMLKIHAAVDFTINPEITTSRPLALAVPEGSNARQVQYIKMILWKNPKMKRWWNVEDPFMPSRMDSITEITVPTSPLSQTTTTTITKTTDNNDDDQLLLRKKNQVMVSPNTSSENEEEYDGNVEQVIAPADDDHDDGASAAVPPKEKKSRVSILRRRLDFVKWW
jgi:hypothetical protein